MSNLMDIANSLPDATPAQAPSSNLLKAVNTPGFFDNKTQLTQRVKDAQTTTPFESLAVPVGAALTDTFRSLKQLGALGAGGIGPGFNPAPYMAAKAQNDALQQQEQPARDAAADQNPSTYYGMYAPTSILSMAPLGEGVGGAASKALSGLSQAPKILPRVAAFMGGRGAQGAAYGAQMPGDTPTNMAIGAVAGPLGEGALKGAGLALKVAGKSAGATADVIRKMAMPGQQAQQTVQKIIGESSTGNPVLNPSQIPGVNLTAGGQSLDPGLQSLEQAVRSRVSGVPNEAVFQSQQRANNTAIRGELGKIANPDSPLQDSSQTAYKALSDAQEARQSQEQDLWGQIPDKTKVNAYNTSAAIDGYINKQSVTNQRIIQRLAPDFIGDFKAAVAKYAPDEIDESNPEIKMPFTEIKDLRSTLGQHIRDAQTAGNYNGARLLKGMDQKLLSSLGDENAFIGIPLSSGNSALDSAQQKLAAMSGPTSQQLGDTYNAARKFTADTHNKYFTKDVASLLDKDPAKMLDTATQTPDNLKGYLNAVSQAPDGGTAGKQALRDYLLSKATQASNMSARGGDTPFLNGQTFKQFVAKNQGVLSQVFSGDELNNMNKLGDAAYRNIATEAATPRIGSNTVQKYLGNAAMPGIGMGKVGAAIGSIRDLLVSNYKGKTEQLLRDTLLNPQDKNLAAMLDKPMNPQNMGSLITYMKATKGLQDKVPLLFGAAVHAPQTFGTRLLTQQTSP